MSVTTTLTLVEDLREGDVCKFLNGDSTVVTVARNSDSFTVYFKGGNELRFPRQQGVFNLVEVAV